MALSATAPKAHELAGVISSTLAFGILGTVATAVPAALNLVGLAFKAGAPAEGTKGRPPHPALRNSETG